MRPISEKGFEILFNRFLLQAFKLGELILYAPTSYEEFTNGYDTKITGLGSFREIILQFKSATINKSGDLFTVKITEHQHETLKDYEEDTAYYIVPTFRTLKELNEVQASIKSSSDFLKHCICIEVSSLPRKVDFIQYIKPESHNKSPEIKYKTPADGSVKKAAHKLKGKAWMRGSSLIEKFKKNKIGSIFEVSKTDGIILHIDHRSYERVQGDSHEQRSTRSFSAIQVRKNLEMSADCKNINMVVVKPVNQPIFLT